MAGVPGGGNMTETDVANSAAIRDASIPVVAVRSRRRIHLGPLRIEVRSNRSRFDGFRFFSAPADTKAGTPGCDAPPHFTVTLCDLNIDGPWPTERLMTLRDRSYRAGRMATGYYITDHFGRPAWLISRGTEYWLFTEDFTGILWPYLVKYLLTIYSMQHDMLHIKAAAIAVNGRAAILVGRGGSGKTVLLAQLCNSGASFLSNTHSLVDGDRIVGVSTAIRVRKDPFFGALITARRLAPSVKQGEFIADPRTDLGWQSAQSARVSAIFLLDYKGPQTRYIAAIDGAVMFDYMDQFALALNVYGLKEDVLDYLNADVRKFSAATTNMRSKLHTLVSSSRCYYVSCDAADDCNVRSIYNLLRHG
jgi:hypothetical protein